MTVVWKTIPCFTKYDASNFGNIRNIKTKRIMKQDKNKGNYMKLTLVNDTNERKNVFVHRVCAFAFLDNPKNYATVNHKNHDRSDNNIINLEWASHTQQSQHSRAIPYEKKRLVCARKVDRFDLKTGEVLQTYDSLTDAGNWLIAQNLTTSSTPFKNISEVCLGRRKSAYGFCWRFSPDETIENETWSPLPSTLINGVDNFMISNMGRVKNKTGRIAKTFEKNGSVMVSISTHYNLRRLIACSFIENPDNLPCVINIDGDKENCAVNNVKWVSHSETRKK